jgi:ferritin-like metal-binding protein YciE
VFCGLQAQVAGQFHSGDSKMTVASWFSKMTGTATTLDNLEKVLLLQLRDLYSAEHQLVNALPKMADAASSSQLKKAFQSHLRETRNQVTRLEKAFQILNEQAAGETCDAMKGLIAEGSEIIDMEGEASVKDAALIAAAQRVEHYEIAGYGCARAFARRLGKSEIARLLQETIEEEGNADKLLTSITESLWGTSGKAASTTPSQAAQDQAAKKASPRSRKPSAVASHDGLAAAQRSATRSSPARKTAAARTKKRATKSKA